MALHNAQFALVLLAFVSHPVYEGCGRTMRFSASWSALSRKPKRAALSSPCAPAWPSYHHNVHRVYGSIAHREGGTPGECCASPAALTSLDRRCHRLDHCALALPAGTTPLETWCAFRGQAQPRVSTQTIAIHDEVSQVPLAQVWRRMATAGYPAARGPTAGAHAARSTDDRASMGQLRSFSSPRTALAARCGPNAASAAVVGACRPRCRLIEN